MFDNVSRHDERIKNLIDENKSINDKHDKIDKKFSKIEETLNNLGNKVQKALDKVDSLDSLGQKLFDGFWKTALLVIGAYILYLLNLN